MNHRLSLWLAGVFALLASAAPALAQCSPYYRIVRVPDDQGVSVVRIVPLGTPAEEIRYGAPASAAQPGYYSEDYRGPKDGKTEPNNARIRVRLPARAELWVDGKKLSLTGTVREFTTPTLRPDKVYSYLVKSRWVDEDGITVEKSLRVRTFSGTRVTVNFVRPRPSFVGTGRTMTIPAPPAPPPPDRWTAPVP